MHLPQQTPSSLRNFRYIAAGVCNASASQSRIEPAHSFAGNAAGGNICDIWPGSCNASCLACSVGTAVYTPRGRQVWLCMQAEELSSRAGCTAHRKPALRSTEDVFVHQRLQRCPATRLERPAPGVPQLSQQGSTGSLGRHCHAGRGAADDSRLGGVPAAHGSMARLGPCQMGMKFGSCVDTQRGSSCCPRASRHSKV